jgi:hypothetical protein
MSVKSEDKESLKNKDENNSPHKSQQQEEKSSLLEFLYQVLEMLGLKKEDVSQADVQKIIATANNKKSEKESLAHLKNQLETKQYGSVKSFVMAEIEKNPTLKNKIAAISSDFEASKVSGSFRAQILKERALTKDEKIKEEHIVQFAHAVNDLGASYQAEWVGQVTDSELSGKKSGGSMGRW